MSVVNTTDLKPRPDEGVEHQFADAAELAEPAHRISGMCSTSLSALVWETGRKAFGAAGHLGHDAGDLGAAEISPH